MPEYKEAFIVSDIHGCHEEFEELLKGWKPDRQQLILAGDYVDRGKRSDLVLMAVHTLMSQGHIALLGNHDMMLLDYLTANVSDEERFEMWALWYYQGGDATARSILSEGEDPKGWKELREALLGHTYVRDTLELLVPHYEFGDVLVVHAGIPQEYHEDWKKTPLFDKVWFRGMDDVKNETGKVIVVGHTPVGDVQVNDVQDIIMIDGGCAYGGLLNGIVINDKGELLETHCVPCKAN